MRKYMVLWWFHWSFQQNNSIQGQMDFHFSSMGNSTKFVAPNDFESFEVKWGGFIFSDMQQYITKLTNFFWWLWRSFNMCLSQMEVYFSQTANAFTSPDVHIHNSTLGGCIVKVEDQLLVWIGLNSTMSFKFSS